MSNGRPARAAAAALIALAAVGCGGSDGEPADVEPRTPDEEAILQVVEDYELATREGDVELFCNRVLLRGDHPSCPRVIGQAMSDPESDLASEEEVTVHRIKVDRGTAEVEITDDGERYEAMFVKTADGWRFLVFD